MFKNLAAKLKRPYLKNTIYRIMVFVFAPVLYDDISIITYSGSLRQCTCTFTPASDPFMASTVPTSKSLKCALIPSPSMCLGQYFRFLMRADEKTHLFCSSAMPCKTQKPESSTTTFYDPQMGRVRRNNKSTVLPKDENSFGAACFGSSLPSAISKEYRMPLLPHKIVWYSFLRGQVFRGTHMMPGQVNFPTYLLIDSSKHETHEGENLYFIF